MFVCVCVSVALLHLIRRLSEQIMFKKETILSMFSFLSFPNWSRDRYWNVEQTSTQAHTRAHTHTHTHTHQEITKRDEVTLPFPEAKGVMFDPCVIIIIIIMRMGRMGRRRGGGGGGRKVAGAKWLRYYLIWNLLDDLTGSTFGLEIMSKHNFKLCK